MDSQFDPDPRYRMLEAGETITTECEYHSGTTGWIKVTDRDIIRSTRFDPTQARPCRIKINDHAPTNSTKATQPAYAKLVSKYARPCKGITIDVYDVLKAFEVTNPAIAHAVKKLLAPGKRGAKSWAQDIDEAISSCKRGLEIGE